MWKSNHNGTYLKERESVLLYHKAAAFDLAVCIILYLQDTTTKRFTHTNPGLTYYTQAAGQITQTELKKRTKTQMWGDF